MGTDYLLFMKEISESYIKGFNIPDDEKHKMDKADGELVIKNYILVVK